MQLALFLATALLLHIVVHFAGRLLPQEQPVDLTDWPPEMLRQVASRANFYGTLAALASFLVLLPLWFVAAYWLDFRLLPRLAAGEFVTVPIQWGRWIRGPVAAYLLASLIAMWAMRLVFRWRYDLMMAAGNKAFGFRARAFFYWTFVWILPFCLEYELHSLGQCVHFQSAVLIVRQSPLFPARRHPYPHLTSIELAQPYTEDRAAIGRSPECRLQFQDGYVFDDPAWMLPWDSAGKTRPWSAVCHFISQRSGRPLKIVARIE